MKTWDIGGSLGEDGFLKNKQKKANAFYLICTFSKNENYVVQKSYMLLGKVLGTNAFLGIHMTLGLERMNSVVQKLYMLLGKVLGNKCLPGNP